jgi:hypothetical protein
MEIPVTWAPLLVSAVRDAVLYQEQCERRPLRGSPGNCSLTEADTPCPRS